LNDDSRIAAHSSSGAPLFPGERPAPDAECIVLNDSGPGTVVEETEIDGGHVPAGPPDFVAESREKTRGKLLSQLVLLLAMLLLCHYIAVSVFVFTGRAEVKSLETAFNASLPLLAGLLGSAVAFYFKEK